MMTTFRSRATAWLRRLGWVPLADLEAMNATATTALASLARAVDEAEEERARRTRTENRMTRAEADAQDLRLALAADDGWETWEAPTGMGRYFEPRAVTMMDHRSQMHLLDLEIRPRHASIRIAFMHRKLAEAMPEGWVSATAKRWVREWAAFILPDVMRGLRQCVSRS